MSKSRHADRALAFLDRDLAAADPDVAHWIREEERRQNQNLELIASENWVSRAVREAQGSVLTNKYAEGYPGKRYYGGCEFVDKIETLAIERAKALFGAEHANVQPHSGSQANMAAYLTAAKPGDTILGMNLSHGGHLTHGHPLSFSGLEYKVVAYGVRPGRRADRLRRARAPGARAPPEDHDRGRLRLRPRDRLSPLRRGGRRGRGGARGRHRAHRRPRHRGAPHVAGALRAVRHVDDAQDPAGAARRARPLPRRLARRTSTATSSPASRAGRSSTSSPPRPWRSPRPPRPSSPTTSGGSSKTRRPSPPRCRSAGSASSPAGPTTT